MARTFQQMRWWVIYLYLLPYLSSGRRRSDHQPLEFVSEPSSLLVEADGKRTALKCSALPSDSQISWLFNGSPILESAFEGFIRISKNKLVIRLPKTGASRNGSAPEELTSAGRAVLAKVKEGVFQCLAKYDRDAMVSQPAKLIVASLEPFPHQEDVTLSVTEGNIAVVPCSPPYSVPDAVTEFHFNGSVIDRSGGRYYLMPSGDLQIFHVRPEDAGIYRCVAFNPFLGVKTNATHKTLLRVRKSQNQQNNRNNQRNNQNHPIRFAVTPKAFVRSVMGSNVTLECVATGSPVPNVTWFKMDGSLPKWRHVQVGGNLVLIGVRRGDEGTYVCRASSSDPSNSITANSVLDVQEMPQIVKSLEDKTLAVGQELSLECSTKGKPKPIVTWIFNGYLIKEADELAYGMSVKGNKITVRSLNPQSHSGVYQCFASNELGSTYSYSQVTIVDPNQREESSDQFFPGTDETREGDDSPADLGNSNRRRTGKKNHKGVKMAPPSKPEITRLSEDSVMVRWDVPQNDGLPILFFKVQYKEINGRASDWMTVDEDIAPHIHSYAVSDMKTGGKYRFRIAAVYSNNDNKLGPTSAKFTLLKEPPMKRPTYGPTISAAEAVSPSAIRLDWKFLDIDLVPVEGFFIYYRATHTAGDYLKITVLGANTRSHIISHLLPLTSYDMKMQCFNEAGTSEFSKIYTVKTFSSPKNSNPLADEDEEEDEDNAIPNGFVPVTSHDDRTLYAVLGIAVGALILVVIVCITLCIVRNKQQGTQTSAGKRKGGKERHPKTGSGSNHNHINFHKHDYPYGNYHKANGHLANGLNGLKTASSGFMLKDHESSDHEIHIRINPLCEDAVESRSRTLTSATLLTNHHSTSTRDILRRAASASQHSLPNHGKDRERDFKERVDGIENGFVINTTERRRRDRFAEEQHPNCFTNFKVNHRSSSFTRLNGTLERKRKSRTDLVAVAFEPKEREPQPTLVSRCSNGAPASTNGPLVIMQSSC